MRLIIAGVSGSLGRYLANHLLIDGHEVIGISRRDPEIEGITHIAHDLRLARDLGFSSDSIVINAAAVTRDGVNRQVFNANLEIARNCISLTRGPQLLVSSSSVYDLRKPSVSVREIEATGNYPFLNSYSESKFRSELLYRESGLPGIILRPHALVGLGDDTLLPRVRNSVRRGKLRLPRGGVARHEFTSFENFTQAVKLSLKKLVEDENGMTTLNVSDGRSTQLSHAIKQSLAPEEVEIRSIPTSIAMLAARLQEIATPIGREPKLSRYAVSQLAFDRSYNLDNIRESLGYTPVTNSF